MAQNALVCTAYRCDQAVNAENFHFCFHGLDVAETAIILPLCDECSARDDPLLCVYKVTALRTIVRYTNLVRGLSDFHVGQLVQELNIH